MQGNQKEYILKLMHEIKEIERKIRNTPMPELKREDFFLFHETGNRLVYENAYFGRRKYLTVYAILALWDNLLSEAGILNDKLKAAELNSIEREEYYCDGVETASKPEDYIKSLETVIVNICDEEFWALPAHVNFDKINNIDTKLTIDLFAAETAQALSEIVIRLYDQLSQNVIDKVKNEVCRRVLIPFVNSDIPYSWWEMDRCNWSAVCAGSIGMSAINIALLHDKNLSDKNLSDESLSDKNLFNKLEKSTNLQAQQKYICQLDNGWEENIIKRVCASMKCYLDGMEDDGACTEGLGYYNYGVSFYTAFIEACEQVCEHIHKYAISNKQLESYKIYTVIYKYVKEGFLSEEKYIKKWEKIALFQQKCYFTGGVSISFSDGSTKEPFLPGLTAYLKHCCAQVKTPDYKLARSFESDACYRYLTNERNISWLVKYGDTDKIDTVKDSINTSNITKYLLPKAQWMICVDQKGNGFAAKGGNNDENHNHNDIGHFLCVYNGEMLLTDLGAGEYTKDYFSDKRYEIFCNRSFGHSVPIINGMEQCAGKKYCADSFIWNDADNILTIDFKSAYKEGCISKITRKIKMIGTDKKDNMQIEVEDCFELNENTKTIEENLVTTYMPIIENNRIIIQGNQGKCIILIEDNSSPVEQFDCNYNDHSGKEQIAYRIKWKVSIKDCIKSASRMCITFSDIG